MEYPLKKQLRLLVQLAMSDTIFTDSERDTIRHIGVERGATQEEVDEIRHALSEWKGHPCAFAAHAWGEVIARKP